MDIDKAQVKALADRVMTDRRFCSDEAHKTLAAGCLALLAEIEALCKLPTAWSEVYEQSVELDALRVEQLVWLNERDQLKAANEALSKDAEAYRLLSFCHGAGTLEMISSNQELFAEVRRLKILVGEPVPPTAEEFVGPYPEGPTARIRRKIAAMAKEADTSPQDKDRKTP